MSRTFLVACGVTACLAWAPQAVLTSAPQQSSPAAQTPAVDPALGELVQRFVAATRDERIAMVQARPEILTPPFRQLLSQQGVDQRNGGTLNEAEQTFNAMLFLGRQYQQPITEINALLGLGSVEGVRSEFRKSRAYLQEAYDLSVTHNHLPGQQQALSNLATVKRRTGDTDGAFASLNASLALARQVGDPLALARVFNNFGITYNDIGLGARALDFYNQSLALKEQNNATAVEITNTLSNIGGVFAGQGDYTTALDYFRRALAKIENSGRLDLVTSVYNNLGQVYASLADYPTARTYLTQGLAMAERIEDSTRMATALYLLGTIDLAEGKLEASEATQRRALALREAKDDRLGVIESLTEMASLLERRQRLTDAVPYGERAIALATESRLINQLWRAQLTLGHVHFALGHDAVARRLYEDAIENIENVRHLAAGGERTRQKYMEERMGPYYGLAALDARAGRPFNALADIDRARARALVDILSYGHLPADRLTPEQRTQDARMTQNVIVASDLLDAEIGTAHPDPKRIAELDAAVSSARLARESFLAGLYAQNPDLRIVSGNTPEITTERVSSVLTPGTALVTFVLDDQDAWVYVVTRGAGGPIVTARKLAVTVAQVNAMSDRFARQIASRDLAFSTTARQLYAALFAPVDAQLVGASHVIVIPDGPLWKVPFQALQTSRGRFVIEEHAVSYTPSIAALVALEERRKTRKAVEPFLVALGDPAVGAANDQPGTSPQRSVPTVRLPEAAREVQSLGRLYGADRSAVLTDAQATETALRSLVSRASVLHVATHGVLDDINPMYSRLLLAPGAASTATRDHTNDGRIEAWEVLDMDITANIAVLSACQTARGGVGFGEGVIGLSWSLFAAGASTAVVSQWEVDSANTTNLMIAFHQRLLKTGATPTTAPEALRQAAITLIRNPASRHPFYWAGFITVGAK